MKTRIDGDINLYSSAEIKEVINALTQLLPLVEELEASE